MEIEKQKGNILFRSKRPWKKKILTVYLLIDLILILGIILSLTYLILYFPLPIFEGFVFGLLTLICGLNSLIVSYLIIHRFFRFLFIYENGIEIRNLSFIPLKNKLIYIPFEEIMEIEIEKDQNEPIILIFQVKDEKAYEVDKFIVPELQKAIDLIFMVKEKITHPSQ